MYLGNILSYLKKLNLRIILCYREKTINSIKRIFETLIAVLCLCSREILDIQGLHNRQREIVNTTQEGRGLCHMVLLC
jgi:hypothetical protein